MSYAVSIYCPVLDTSNDRDIYTFLFSEAMKRLTSISKMTTDIAAIGPSPKELLTQTKTGQRRIRDRLVRSRVSPYHLVQTIAMIVTNVSMKG
jgi:hypothetical protein